MKNKVLLIMILLIPITICFNACSNNKATSGDNSIINSIGNYSNNIANRALVSKQGDWIFYYSTGGSFGIGEGLYKSKTDGSQREKVTSGTVSDINVLGDWIYYVLAEKSRKDDATIYRYNLYKIKTNGSQKSLVLNDCDNVNIINDNIYYRIYIDVMDYQKAGVNDYPLKEENGNIYSMKLDGSQKTKLINENNGRFIIQEHFIYHSNNDGIYQTNIDGSNTKMLIPGNINSFKLENNNMYYVVRDFKTDESNISIYNISTGVNKEIKMQKDLIIEILPHKDNIYYITSNFNVYKIEDDGKEDKEVSKGILNIYAFEEYILGWTGEKELKKIF